MRMGSPSALGELLPLRQDEDNGSLGQYRQRRGALEAYFLAGDSLVRDKRWSSHAKRLQWLVRAGDGVRARAHRLWRHPFLRLRNSLGQQDLDLPDVAWTQSAQLAELASCVTPEQITRGGLVGPVLVDGGKPRDDFELRTAVEQNTFEQDCFNEQRRVLGIASPFQKSSAIPANFKVGHVFVPSERLGGVAPHCGQSLQSAITIMISEPIATAAGQINGNFSSTPTATARM